MARKAGPAGQSSRAGGARAAGPARHISSTACLVAREAGLAGQKLQMISLVDSRFRGSVNCGAHSMENRFQVTKFLFEVRMASSLF